MEKEGIKRAQNEKLEKIPRRTKDSDIPNRINRMKILKAKPYGSRGKRSEHPITEDSGGKSEWVAGSDGKQTQGN